MLLKGIYQFVFYVYDSFYVYMYVCIYVHHVHV